MTQQATSPSGSANRQWLLGGALALTLAATLWSALSSDAEDSLVQPVAGERRAPLAAGTARKAQPAAPDTVLATNWAAIERAAWAVPDNSYFAAWAPPPPPPAPKQVAAPPAPPPAPMAPAFAYQLIGRLVEGDQATALLAGPVRSLAVKAGDVVDGQWRVDQVTERGLNLTWLPAKLTQTISFKPNP